MKLEADIPLSLWENSSPVDRTATIYPLKTPFGKATAAFCGEALVWFGFGQRSGREFRSEWPGTVEVAAAGPSEILPQLLGALAGENTLTLQPVGTPFQLLTWQLLLGIPYGKTATYQELAERLGSRHYTRAVARAVARNPIAWIIPCHRVIPHGSAKGGYRWGLNRKNRLLHWEKEHASVETAVRMIDLS